MAKTKDRADAARARIQDAERAVEQAQVGLVDAVREARTAGLSWAQIGDVLGVTRQAVWERFHHLVDTSG